MRRSDTFGSLVTGLLFLGVAFASSEPAPVSAACGGSLYISEYVEGSGSNQALEIFSGNAGSVDLGANGVAIDIYANGSPTVTIQVPLAGTVTSNDVFVVARVDLPVSEDQIASTMVFNGDDAIVLRSNATVLDVIGQIGVDPGTAWGTGGNTTANQTLQRRPQYTGDTNGADAFDPSIEWDAFPQDYFDGLGAHVGSSCVPSVGGVSELAHPATLPALNEHASQGKTITYGLAGSIAMLAVSAGGWVAWRRYKAV